VDNVTCWKYIKYGKRSLFATNNLVGLGLWRGLRLIIRVGRFMVLDV